MIVVGLTGGIGSGKTTVANFFFDLNVPIYIADDAAKNLMNTSGEIKEEILKLFGQNAYINNSPNRKYISFRVFNDKKQLDALNNIIHPAVSQDFKNWKKNQDAPYVIYEAAILFETGGYKTCDFNVLVTAPKEEKIKRLQKRDQSSVEEIQARMNNQWSDEEKKNLADFEISNLDLSRTRQQVETLHVIFLRAAKN